MIIRRKYEIINWGSRFLPTLFSFQTMFFSDGLISLYNTVQTSHKPCAWVSWTKVWGRWPSASGWLRPSCLWWSSSLLLDAHLGSPPRSWGHTARWDKDKYILALSQIFDLFLNGYFYMPEKSRVGGYENVSFFRWSSKLVSK